MENEVRTKGKFWKGVLVGSLVTAFAGLIIVGIAAGINLIGQTVMDNPTRKPPLPCKGYLPFSSPLPLPENPGIPAEL